LLESGQLSKGNTELTCLSIRFLKAMAFSKGFGQEAGVISAHFSFNHWNKGSTHLSLQRFFMPLHFLNHAL
jgi:hypothetical protein